MRRRDFLTGAAAATVAGLGSTAAWAAEARTSQRLKTAVFSGMFKKMSLKATMENLAAIGYDGIEIAAGYGTDHLDLKCTPQRAREIKAIAADNRLAIVLIYTSLGGNILAGDKQRAEGLDQGLVQRRVMAKRAAAAQRAAVRCRIAASSRITVASNPTR